jgi:hypothetical protein
MDEGVEPPVLAGVLALLGPDGQQVEWCRIRLVGGEERVVPMLDLLRHEGETVGADGG